MQDERGVEEEGAEVVLPHAYAPGADDVAVEARREAVGWPEEGGGSDYDLGLVVFEST